MHERPVWQSRSVERTSLVNVPCGPETATRPYGKWKT